MAIVRTIEQVQAELEAFLSRVDFPHESEVLQAFVAPPGMEARVSLRYADGHRKIRRTADASYFDPALCERNWTPAGACPSLNSKDRGVSPYEFNSCGLSDGLACDWLTCDKRRPVK